MKVRVDPTKCDAYGNCAGHLAEVFKLDDWGYAFVEGDGEVPDGKEKEARRAVADCPANAITAEE